MYEHDLEKYWKTVVNTVEDGIMILDKEGIIVSINDAISKITGYSRKELVGEPCSVLNCDICEQAREDSGRHWCVLFKTGRMDRKRCKFIKKD